jgi:hypothetical protein
MALHIGFGVSLRLGTFFWICFSAQQALVPSFVWDKLVYPYIFRTKVLYRWIDID